MSHRDRASSNVKNHNQQSSGYSSRQASQRNHNNLPNNHYSHFQSNQKHDLNEVISCPKTRKRYFASEFLGKGGFAKVYRLRKLDRYDCVANPREGLAIKVVQKSTIKKDHQRQKMALEIKLHKQLGTHEHIVQFHSSFEDQSRVFVILEYCQNRSLMEVHKRRKTITQPELRFYMKQILSALIYIHDRNVIHRDLKLSNILLAKGMMVKVCDFGLATTLTELNSKRQTLCGTPNYIAPEILNKQGHGKPADVWSTGVAMFALLVGVPPFETSSLSATYRKIKDNNYTMPSSYKRQAVGNMIKAMLNPKADHRPSVDKLIQNKFIVHGFCPEYLPDSAMACEPHFNHEQSICVFADNNQHETRRSTRRNELPIKADDHILSGNNKATTVSGRRTRQTARLNNDQDDLRPPLHEMNNVEINDRAQVRNAEVQLGPARLGLNEGSSEYSLENDNQQNNRNKYEVMKDYAHDILKQLTFLDSWFAKSSDGSNIRYHRKVDDNADMEDAVEPSIRPVYWISKWVDYSDKYGLGYQLIDESVGVLFNDTRRMILHNNQNHIQAVEPDMVTEKMTTAREIEDNFRAIEERYNKLNERSTRTSRNSEHHQEQLKQVEIEFRLAKDLNKKYKLLKHFRQYMKDHLVTAGDDHKITSIDNLRRLPSMVKWFRTKAAICMMLTNGIVQINFFSCHSKLIFDPSVEAVTYINEQKQFATYSIQNLKQTGINTKFFKKLVMAKNLVVNLYKHLRPNSGVTGKMLDSAGSIVNSQASTEIN